MPACSAWDPFPSRAKKTSPLCSPNPSLGCGQPAPPLQCWRRRNIVLKQEGNDFFASGNLSPVRLCWEPTLHGLGVRGCGTARMEGTFFSLGTDSGAMVLHCYLRVCVCVRVLCGAWMLLFLFGTTTSKDMGELDGYAALSRDPMHASLPGTLPPTTGPAGTTQLRETGRP